MRNDRHRVSQFTSYQFQEHLPSFASHLYCCSHQKNISILKNPIAVTNDNYK